ncbi:MAG: LysR family transcriptional regulator [Paenibacillaceae bacterium]|nr:LysR family transcriptional regulator [Paenibacillaceae bacterium]
MEFRQLQYFIKVAKMQHVTHAAEEMHVAQSAVSRQIHLLEEELGVALFSQKGRNLQLTPVGRLFLSRVEAILANLDRAVNEVHEFLDPDAGEIRIGFPHSLGMNLLPKIIAKFRQDHPNVKFKLKQGAYNGLIHDVKDGEVDLAIVSPCPKKLEHVTGELLFSEEMFAILPMNHPLAVQTSIRLEQLQHESFVMFNEGYSLRSIVMEACQKAGFRPIIGFEGEETDTIRGLVTAGMGVSLLPEMALMHNSPFMPAVVKVSEPSVFRTIGLIRRSGEKLPLVAEVFQRFLLDYFA